MKVRVNDRIFHNIADAGKFLMKLASEGKAVRIEHLKEGEHIWREEN